MADSIQATLNKTNQVAISSSFKELLPILQWLDRLLERSIASAKVAYGSAAADPYRGMHLTPEDVEQLLQRKPGVSPFPMDVEQTDDRLSTLISDRSLLFWLQQTFSLSDFDLELVVIALAPEIDRRYERIYAYLQDDVTCRLPSVDLALNLLCATGADKLLRRAHFAPDAPLLQHQLLHLVADPNQIKPTLLAHYLVLDEQIIRLLLGQKGLDTRLAPFCQLIQPAVSLDDLLVDPTTKQALATLTMQSWQNQQPLQLYFEGSDIAIKQQTAEALATVLKTPLLVADLAKIGDTRDIDTALKLLFRESSFQNTLLYLDNLDSWEKSDRAIHSSSLLTAIAAHPGIVIVSGAHPWTPAASEIKGMLTVPFPIPDFNLRRQAWQTELAKASVSIEEPSLDALVDRFRLTQAQIADAVATAHNSVRWTAAAASSTLEAPPLNSPNPELADIYAAARSQSGHDLTIMAQKINLRRTLKDIVLPPDPQKQLQEICNQVRYRHIVQGEWGFDRKLSLGKGLNVLFYGPPGTGKTMAAEAIANELQLDLYKIDLSQVVSKYIGETEKNLGRIFDAAENANVVLLFDEADAILGKRSEVKDAHDRYANLEVAYLLQKMEEYEGISILTTNLRQNLDQAFTRRIRFMVEFPFPKAEHRLEIWQSMWTKETPLSVDIDFDRIAQKFELAGGSIRNIALAAAFLAASNGQEVTKNHLLKATRREFQKMGQLINELEFSQI